MIEVVRYRRPDGTAPFDEWVTSLRDRHAQARIALRLLQVENGNFGDRTPVGEGVIELRIHFGAGFRIYFGRHGNSLVLLLGGGSKRTQVSDIEIAKKRWREWKEMQR